MRCPNCGSTAIVRGSRWECGWCGDYGRITDPAARRRETVTISVSVIFSPDLGESWMDLKAALTALDRGGDVSLLPRLGKVLLHEITLGVKRCDEPLPERKWQELEAFLKSTPDLNVAYTTAGIRQKVAQGDVLYAGEGAISERVCGAFWAALIELLPQGDLRGKVREKLDALFRELAFVCAYFSDKVMGDENERRHEIEDAFFHHWQEEGRRKTD